MNGLAEADASGTLSLVIYKSPCILDDSALVLKSGIEERQKVLGRTEDKGKQNAPLVV